MVRVRKIRSGPTTPVDADYVLGIACTGHGASLALVGRDGLCRASVFDRWMGTKHTLIFSKFEHKLIAERIPPIGSAIHSVFRYAYGRFPDCRIFEDVFPDWLAWLLRDTGVQPKHINLVVTSDSYFATHRAMLAYRLDRWLPSLRLVATMEHHDIHQRQAFWQSGFDSAAILTLDTCGGPLFRLWLRRLSGTIARKLPNSPFETLSEMFYRNSSAGHLYAIVNHHVGFRQGDEGKTMGLAPYGRPVLFEELRKYLTLRPDGSFRFLDLDDFHRRLSQYVGQRPPGKDSPVLERHEDVAYAGQALLELIVCNAFRCALRLTGCEDLVYAGGVALNGVANQIAVDSARPRRIYIAPNASDTGQALGCALAGAYEVCRWIPRRLEVTDYLGPSCSERELEDAARCANVHLTRPVDAENVIAQCLANGHIVARYFGCAEFGPRALGNRSILCDPRRPDMKDRLNAKVKHRESFRPFAPTVLEEYVADWFALNERSPYMLRVVAVKKEVRDLIPSVVHVDGSARVQTVSQSENRDYWLLIDSFRKLTGVPMLLNTSFNVQGKPIVESPADAVACFLSTEIDILFMAPFVLCKRPLSEYLHEELSAITA